MGGWWWFECAAGQNAALSQRFLVMLLNTVCHKGLFLLHTGAVFMQSSAFRNMAQTQFLRVICIHSSATGKRQVRKSGGCVMLEDWFPPHVSSEKD